MLLTLGLAKRMGRALAGQPMSDAAASLEWDGIDGLLDLRSRLHDWARTDERILAAVAFGSTERTDRPADAWSDLDLLSSGWVQGRLAEFGGAANGITDTRAAHT